MRTRGDDRFGGKCEPLGRGPAPRTAVHVDEDRRVRLRRAKDVEVLGFARAVGEANRATQARTHRVAQRIVAPEDLIPIRCVDELIVGSIERGLIVA